MAVFEDNLANEKRFDDSISLSCNFDHHRIVDGHTEYIIKIWRGLDQGKSWTIFKRYKEFEKLDKELHASSFEIRLPPKKYVGNLKCQFVIQRQGQLQNYMNKVLSNSVLSSSIHLKRFLNPENHSYSVQFQETAFQYASMALRGKPTFHNLRPLTDVGWRYNKQYSKVKKLNDTRREHILSWISEYGVDKCLSNKELQSSFKVFLELSHPYIMPIITGNCSPNGTLIIRPDCIGGSLRELIYERSRFDSFIQKCRYRNERLIIPENAVTTIAVQVLHALMFLHQKNVPYGNLHTGNIFIEDNVAKISDVENSVFGLESFYKRHIIENRRIRTLQDVDVYCFGHVLYEMAFGERLESYCCDQVPSDCYDNLKPVLELILDSSTENKLPSVSIILSMEAFKLCSSSIIYETKLRCKISSETQALFQRCQTTIENKIRNEQLELRRYRKIRQMQEKVESEEKNECTRHKKEKRKLKKTRSQSSIVASNNSDRCENVSNSSTPTTISTDSSTPTSVCDKMNGKEPTNSRTDLSTPTESVPTPEVSDGRNEFLQSIVSFNKRNLKKANSTSGL